MKNKSCSVIIQIPILSLKLREIKTKVAHHCKCCKKYHDQITSLKQKNTDLIKENIVLKSRQKKGSIKNPTLITNGSLNQGNNNNIEENQINMNQNQTQTYQQENLSLTNFPMNLSTGVQKFLPPTTGEEGSYEAYYYKIEHLLLELTRLMDGVENNINNTNQNNTANQNNTNNQNISRQNNTNNQNISRPESNTQINRGNTEGKRIKIFKNTDPIEEEN